LANRRVLQRTLVIHRGGFTIFRSAME
jgi:hypothetical protein